MPRGGQAALPAGVLDQPVRLYPHERYVELYLAAKDALDDRRSIAGLAPARRGVHPHQPGPVLAPVDGIGDVVEAVSHTDREMLLDRDTNRSSHGVGLRARCVAPPGAQRR